MRLLRSALQRANEVQQIIVDHLNYLNFMPEIAHCVRLAYSENRASIIGMFSMTFQVSPRLSVARNTGCRYHHVSC